MASATLNTGLRAGRRTVPFAASVMTPSLRAEVQAKIAALLSEAEAAADAAHYLIRFLDAADAPVIDMEPSLGWEASAATGQGGFRPYGQTVLIAGFSHIDLEGDETAEVSAQPTTLAPPERPVVTIRPTARQQRAAYRRIGAPVPANLRPFRSLFGGAR